MKIRFATILLFFIGITTLFGQKKGTLSGVITEGESGEPLFGVMVTVKNNPSLGAITDLKGRYSISLKSGKYTIQATYIAFEPRTFENIVISSGEVTVLNPVMKISEDQQLKAVEVVATARRNDFKGIYLEMKHASNIVNGLPSRSMKRVGDSDLGEAMKRVTGVTVKGGKYVYVRGLGNRYTKTVLNGMAIPGLDPDKNTMQIDIFPTSILENVLVYKSFTPNLSGNFTGGLINVETKQFPDSQITRVGVGIGFTQNQTFRKDYLSYKGGRFDIIGFDDGTRKLPFDKLTDIPLEVLNNAELESITRSFNPILSVSQKTAAPNASFSIQTGNRIDKPNSRSLGYNFIFNYSNTTDFYDDFETNTYLKNNNSSENELFKDESRIGVLGKNTVALSTMLSAGITDNDAETGVVFLHSRSAEKGAAERLIRNYNQTGASLIEDILSYSQRSLTSLVIERKKTENNLEISFGNALSHSRVYNPDFRSTTYSITAGDTTLNTGDGAGINRFWRDLNELNENFKVDLTYDYRPNLKLRGGLNALLKWRDFETLSYSHSRKNRSEVSSNPNWFLQPSNIWNTDYDEGTYTIGNFEPANTYNASQYIFAGYLMAEQSLHEKWRAIYGVRIEKSLMFYSGQNNLGDINYSNEKTLDEFTFLPSINLVYALSDEMNLRFSMAKTIARPGFKEKSIAQIYDPITRRTFVGNIDLEQTRIWNYDLRYAWFLKPGELFSIAGFYKVFDGHIELVAFETAPDNVKPRNAGRATLIGAEVELRKKLGSLFANHGGFIDRFTFSGNLCLVHSKVYLRDVYTGNDGETEYELRQENLREGEILKSYRPMAGQSPYSINAGLVYAFIEKKMNVALSYNVQGEQLSIIASGRIPDVYTLPYHSLDLNAKISFGQNLRSQVNIGCRNLLDQSATMVYKSFGSSDKIYQTYKTGRGFSLSYSYTF